MMNVHHEFRVPEQRTNIQNEKKEKLKQFRKVNGPIVEYALSRTCIAIAKSYIGLSRGLVHVFVMALCGIFQCIAIIF